MQTLTVPRTDPTSPWGPSPEDLRLAALARENRLVLWHVYTATAALAVGAIFGVLQALTRANAIVMPASFDYYRMLTAHGVLMALVFTTFFITGLCDICDVPPGSFVSEAVAYGSPG